MSAYAAPTVRNPYVRATPATTASAAPATDRVSDYLLGTNTPHPAERQATSLGLFVGLATWLVIGLCLYFVWDYTTQPAPAAPQPSSSNCDTNKPYDGNLREVTIC